MLPVVLRCILVFRPCCWIPMRCSRTALPHTAWQLNILNCPSHASRMNCDILVFNLWLVVDVELWTLGTCRYEPRYTHRCSLFVPQPTGIKHSLFCLVWQVNQRKTGVCLLYQYLEIMTKLPPTILCASLLIVWSFRQIWCWRLKERSEHHKFYFLLFVRAITDIFVFIHCSSPFVEHNYTAHLHVPFYSKIVLIVFSQKWSFFDISGIRGALLHIYLFIYLLWKFCL